MSTITVTINRSSLVADVRVTSHAEVASISDARLRYLTEAGTEKSDLINQCITNAAAEIYSELRSYLVSAASASANDAFETGDFSFVFDVTARKSAGLATDMMRAIHSYIVDSALAKMYAAVSKDDFSQRHLSRLPIQLTMIQNIFFKKREPVYNNG